MTPAGVAPPVRREQAGERRHEDDVARVRHRPGELLDLRRVADDAEVVAQPADERAGHRDRALQGVRGGRVAEARGDGRDEAVAEWTGRSPVCMSMKQPVPYVHLICPASKQVWPNRAACWSPRSPAIGTPARSPTPSP